MLVFVDDDYPLSLRNPESYGWVAFDANDSVVDCAIKKSPANGSLSWAAITGFFWFKDKATFIKLFKRVMDNNLLINDEYYLDAFCLDEAREGFNCKVCRVESWLSWGTPEELETFKYWQSFLKQDSYLRHAVCAD